MLHSDIPVWIPFVAAAALAAMWLQSASRLARRRQALASLAQRWQLMPNGDNLPLGLTLRNAAEPMDEGTQLLHRRDR